MSWIGDLLKAGIKAKSATIEFTKPVKISGALETTGAFTPTGGLSSNSVTFDNLVNALQEALPQVTISESATGAGTADATVQLVDQNGDAIESVGEVHAWVAGSDMAAPSAITGITASTGTLVTELTANADYLVASDSTGTIVLALDAGGTATTWLMVSIGGFVYSHEFSITA